jgi:hypothetical protein
MSPLSISKDSKTKIPFNVHFKISIPTKKNTFWMNYRPGQLQWSYDSCGFASLAWRQHFSAAAGCFFRRRYENPPAGVKGSPLLERASLLVLFALQEKATAEWQTRPPGLNSSNRTKLMENLMYALCGLSSPSYPFVPHVVEAEKSEQNFQLNNLNSQFSI